MIVLSLIKSEQFINKYIYFFFKHSENLAKKKNVKKE